MASPSERGEPTGRHWHTSPVISSVQKTDVPARLSRAGRVERVVAAARVVLASVSYVAIWLDPSTPARYADETYGLLGLYVVYAVLALVAFWTVHVVSTRWVLLTHVMDLAVFAVLMYLTEGPTSPFFTYVVFAVLAATLRWQWRGTLWTSLAAIVMFIAIGAYASLVAGDPAFELNRFMIRSVYLGVVAALLGYAGYYQHSIERELVGLAAWPRGTTDRVDRVVEEIAPQVAGILKARRVFILWEEEDEPWLHTAEWTEGQLRTARLAPDALGDKVAEPLRDSSFMCADLRQTPGSVIASSPQGPREWRGASLDPALREKLTMNSVMSWPLEGETFEGRLFVAGRPDMIADDLVLGEIVGTLVSSRLEQAYLMQRLGRAAAAEERYRLGRDLHDGLLQSLAAIALQLRSVSDLIPDRATGKRLRELQEVLESEQRDLRTFIRDLRDVGGDPGGRRFDLAQSVRELCSRVERVWPVQVTLTLEGAFEGDPTFCLSFYRAVHEAVVNAARHSGASAIAVSLDGHDAALVARVSDNGRGFPFTGRRDLAALGQANEGPAALRERVIRLHGHLVVDSTPAGSVVIVEVPLPRSA